MITTPTEISLDFNQITQVKFGRNCYKFSLDIYLCFFFFTFANPNHNTQQWFVFNIYNRYKLLYFLYFSTIIRTNWF